MSSDHLTDFPEWLLTAIAATPERRTTSDRYEAPWFACKDNTLDELVFVNCYNEEWTMNSGLGLLNTEFMARLKEVEHRRVDYSQSKDEYRESWRTAMGSLRDLIKVAYKAEGATARFALRRWTSILDKWLEAGMVSSWDEQMSIVLSDLDAIIQGTEFSKLGVFGALLEWASTVDNVKVGEFESCLSQIYELTAVLVMESNKTVNKFDPRQGNLADGKLSRVANLSWLGFYQGFGFFGTLDQSTEGWEMLRSWTEFYKHAAYIDSTCTHAYGSTLEAGYLPVEVDWVTGMSISVEARRVKEGEANDQS